MQRGQERPEQIINRIIYDSFCLHKFCLNNKNLSSEFINICSLANRINNKAKLLKKRIST